MSSMADSWRKDEREWEREKHLSLLATIIYASTMRGEPKDCVAKAQEIMREAGKAEA